MQGTPNWYALPSGWDVYTCYFHQWCINNSILILSLHTIYKYIYNVYTYSWWQDMLGQKQIKADVRVHTSDHYAWIVALFCLSMLRWVARLRVCSFFQCFSRGIAYICYRFMWQQHSWPLRRGCLFHFEKGCVSPLDPCWEVWVKLLMTQRVHSACAKNIATLMKLKWKHLESRV